MKRNWYALIVLLVMALCLAGGGYYIHDSTQQLNRGLQQAYALTQWEDYAAAQQAYYAVAAFSQQRYAGMALLVRRNLVDQLNQTLATLPAYANADNLADLAVENARARAQLDQLEKSFLCCY